MYWLSRVIEDSKETIYVSPNEDYYAGQLQIGPDAKIYTSFAHINYSLFEYSIYNQNLSVINDPTLIGLSCNFDTLTISLGTTRGTGGLPNMPNYNLGSLEGSECDTLQITVNIILQNEPFLIYPNPASDKIYCKFSDNNLSPININSITISDATGRIVKVISKLEGNSIYVDDLQVGLYIVHILTTNNKSYLNKLIIEK